jgi:hypothetical protein
LSSRADWANRKTLLPPIRSAHQDQSTPVPIDTPPFFQHARTISDLNSQRARFDDKSKATTRKRTRRPPAWTPYFGRTCPSGRCALRSRKRVSVPDVFQSFRQRLLLHNARRCARTRFGSDRPCPLTAPAGRRALPVGCGGRAIPAHLGRGTRLPRRSPCW